MIQRHSIILWKKADTNNRNFDDIAKEAFATLNVLYDCLLYTSDAADEL